MAVTGTDFFVISRAGTNFKVSGADVLAYMNANLGTSQYNVADITARNALANMTAGDRVYVASAVGDATVTSGWAIYIYMSPGVWTKVAEQEAMDVSAGGANLTYTPGATQGIVVSDSGSDATIPTVDATNAGLMLPAHKAKLDFLTVTAGISLDAMKVKSDFLTVTAATNLDTLRGASHAAATTGGSALTNPLVVTGQVLTFDIAGLTAAP